MSIFFDRVEIDGVRLRRSLSLFNYGQETLFFIDFLQDKQVFLPIFLQKITPVDGVSPTRSGGVVRVFGF